MEEINEEGKFEGPLVDMAVYGDSPKYYVQLDFDVAASDSIRRAYGRFYIYLNAGGENTTATAQLKNAGFVFEKPIYKDGVFDVNAFWDAVDAFKIDPAKSHKVTVKMEDHKGEISYRVAFVDGPHRGEGGGFKKATRPAPDTGSVPF